MSNITSYGVSVDGNLYYVKSIEKKWFKWHFYLYSCENFNPEIDYDPEYLKNKYSDKILKAVRKQVKEWQIAKRIETFVILDNKTMVFVY